MKECDLCRVSRTYWLITISATVIVLLTIMMLWLSFNSSSELDDRYNSTGQMQLSSGKIIDVSHTIRFKDGRFYAMTKQNNAILETSGQVEYGFLGSYRLRVEKGDVTALTGETDKELVFNLMYGRHKGSTISLVPFHSCLYGLETRQVYCPTKKARSL
jgi:hypothetical protein